MRSIRRELESQRDALTTVTETGVETATRSFTLDALVLATGYDAMTGALAAMQIRGRDGAASRGCQFGAGRARRDAFVL